MLRNIANRIFPTERSSQVLWRPRSQPKSEKKASEEEPFSTMPTICAQCWESRRMAISRHRVTEAKSIQPVGFALVRYIAVTEFHADRSCEKPTSSYVFFSRRWDVFGNNTPMLFWEGLAKDHGPRHLARAWEWISRMSQPLVDPLFFPYFLCMSPNDPLSPLFRPATSLFSPYFAQRPPYSPLFPKHV